MPQRRCPLCLEPLKGTDQLIRHCFRCGTLESVAVSELTKGTHRLLCSSVACRESESVDTGVYLTHAGCTRTNPFWNGSRIEVPGEVSYVAANNEVEPLEHPILERLRAIARTDAGRTQQSMWFPFELYLAVNEYVDERRLGAQVMLSGSRAVGKSTLSTVALNPRSFQPPGGDGDGGDHLVIDDYVYVVPTAQGGYQRFAEYLHASCLVRDRRTAASWTQRTPATEDNLRVAFLRNQSLDGRTASDENKITWATSVLQDLVGSRPKEITRPRPASTAVLAFWDTPGEDNERSLDQRLVRLSDQMDVVAFLIDVQHLTRWGCTRFRGGEGAIREKEDRDSLAVALARVGHFARRRIRKCIIVTKLDLVRDRLSQFEAEAIARFENDQGGWQGEMRKLLMEWLGVSGARTQELELARFLRDQKNMPTFLLSVEGLGTGQATPYGRGFIPFANWCLDRRAVNVTAAKE